MSLRPLLKLMKVVYDGGLTSYWKVIEKLRKWKGGTCTGNTNDVHVKLPLNFVSCNAAMEIWCLPMKILISESLC